MNEIIKLNVGGKMYETRRQTLLAGSMLAKMASGEYSDSTQSDGSYFIDRDGTHFRFILNYLRNGVLPDEILSEFGGELHPEAVFYGLTGLADQIIAQRGDQRPVKPAAVRDPERGILPGQFRFVFDGGEIVETSTHTLKAGFPAFWRNIQEDGSKSVYYLDTIKPHILEIALQFVKTGRPQHFQRCDQDALFQAARTLEAPNLKKAIAYHDY